mgnify:FL=1
MAALDHLVINTLRNMDEAADAFAALGFQLTPRGHHSLGSINHLMVVDGAYLELVGVPAEGLQRQEVLDSPLGLSGLVFQTADADATYQRLTNAGLPALEPLAFSRPVALISGREEAAAFRTVRLARERTPAGRVYFCQHLTPDLVWREEWMRHPNGFCAITRVVIESPDAEADAGLYAGLCDGPATRGADGEHVPLAGAELLIVDGPKPRFATAHLEFETLDVIAARARTVKGVTWQAKADGSASLSLPAFDLSLVCRVASARSRP